MFTDYASASHATSVAGGPALTRDQIRGSASARGYGVAHRKLRESWRPKVEAGEVICWRCDKLIEPKSAWDLGHKDGSKTEYKGPEHRACNRATKQIGRTHAPANVSTWWQ